MANRETSQLCAPLVKLTTCPPPRPTPTGNCPVGSLVLQEADLLKLGKVLLLAQDTANNSIERALHTNRRQGNARATGEPDKAVDETIDETVVYTTIPLETKHERIRASADIGPPSRASLRDDHNNIKSKRFETHRRLGRRKGGKAIAANGNAVTFAAATRSSVCLWCDPSPAGEQQQRRHRVAAASRLKQRQNARQSAVDTASAAASAQLARQPQQPWQQPRRRMNNPYPPSSRTYLQGSEKYRECLRSGKGNDVATKATVNTVRTSPSDSTAASEASECQKSPSEQLVQPNPPGGVPPALLESALAREGGGDRVCPAPTAYFCSWGCARRWNAKFSPVQARHERELKIDIAAGRVVTD